LIALPGDVELHDGMSVKIINAETAAIRGHQNAE